MNAHQNGIMDPHGIRPPAAGSSTGQCSGHEPLPGGQGVFCMRNGESKEESKEGRKQRRRSRHILQDSPSPFPSSKVPLCRGNMAPRLGLASAALLLSVLALLQGCGGSHVSLLRAAHRRHLRSFLRGGSDAGQDGKRLPGAGEDHDDGPVGAANLREAIKELKKLAEPSPEVAAPQQR